MADDAQVNDAGGKKRLRSPPYPMFDLGKAVERVTELHKSAMSHQVGISVLAEAWGMGSSDGKVWRAAAALIQYGFLTDSGTGKSRKFQLTDAAKRIAIDKDPNSLRRKEVLKNAALAPMIHEELWKKFGSGKNLSGTVLTTYLIIDREEEGESPYNPSVVDEVIKTFLASLDYAGLSDSDTVDEPLADKGSDEVPPLSPDKHGVKTGDLVKWTSGGVDQFEARKVNWISEDGSHLRVIGSNTGIPMNEVMKVSGHEGAGNASPSPLPNQVDPAKPATGKPRLDASTSILNGRLQVSADVSADEIDALVSVLEKYKEILKLMH